jgi:hypothetical protein
MGVAQSRTAAGREPRPDREDRLIDGDDQVDRPRFGRPPGHHPGTLAGLPAGGQSTLASATEPVRRARGLAGFRARTVVIES